MAIRASGIQYRALAAYLVEGVTWQRLRDLATRSAADGGLGLFRDGSPACKEVFGQSPCAIIDNRPETDLQFLRLLEGKERTLHRLATKDLEQRDLQAGTRAAILSLADIKSRICRRVLQELLERCQFLYYWTGNHPSVACETSWDDLMQKAVALILSLEITSQVLERFHFKEEAWAALPTRPKTWVELAILQIVGEEDLVAENLVEGLDFHRKVADQAASHLNLLFENAFRTPWLAAKLLSKDRSLARDAACALTKHLATTRPGNRTGFEEHLIGQEELWRNLEDFAKADPPTLLWHDHGRFASLFKFLAPRFLLAPDHVLDAERVHARWQWSCSSKRAQLLQTMNASLRMTHYMEHHQTMPAHDELLPHLRAEMKHLRLSIEALDEEDVAAGWRSSFVWCERFNLANNDLLEAAREAPAAPAAGPGGPFAAAWRNYMKSVFKKGFMYTLSCNPAVILYIADNKTLAGKEDRTYEGEALGRKLTVVFFEKIPGPGGLAQRVNRETLGMQQNLLSIAEILQTLGGPELPADPARTAAQTELLLEREYLRLEITRWKCTVEPAAAGVHVFSLQDEGNAEAAFAAEVPAHQRTRMILARALQRNEELLDDEDLQAAFNKTLPALRGRSGHLFPAPARGRGPRGRGARGRGARGARGR